VRDAFWSAPALRVQAISPLPVRVWHGNRSLPSENKPIENIMVLPTEPVTLSVEQIGELNEKLSTLRHDLNNSLSLIAATSELIRRRPETTEHLWKTLQDQPRKVMETMAKYSRDVEAVLHITRP
jgi:hypothetical protein